MEFTIEELPLKNRKKRSNTRLYLLVKGCRILKKRVMNGRVKFLAGLTVKRELILTVVMIGLALFSLIGRDLWQVQKQKNSLRVLQEEMRQLAVTKQTLHQRAMPAIESLQDRWISEKEGNIENLLTLLAEFSRHFKQEVTMTSLQKYPRNDHLHIKGHAKNYDTIFQLENFLQSQQWQSELNVAAQNHVQEFTLQIRSFHRLAFK